MTADIANKSALVLLVNSVGRAALDARSGPMANRLQPWVDSVRSHVTRMGKYSKSAVIYFPFSPPPAFWDYKCKKCGWYQAGSCGVVAGEILPGGWCALWTPPANYKPFTWPLELLKGNW
jgi:hypothetical protein